MSQCGQDGLHRRIRQRLQFGVGAVLDRVRHPHHGGLEPKRTGLVLRRVSECGGGHQHAGHAQPVQGFDVMQTA